MSISSKDLIIAQRDLKYVESSLKLVDKLKNWKIFRTPLIFPVLDIGKPMVVKRIQRTLSALGTTTFSFDYPVPQNKGWKIQSGYVFAQTDATVLTRVIGIFITYWPISLGSQYGIYRATLTASLFKTWVFTQIPNGDLQTNQTYIPQWVDYIFAPSSIRISMTTASANDTIGYDLFLEEIDVSDISLIPRSTP